MNAKQISAAFARKRDLDQNLQRKDYRIGGAARGDSAVAGNKNDRTFDPDQTCPAGRGWPASLENG
jgi:hypothetical protein